LACPFQATDKSAHEFGQASDPVPKETSNWRRLVLKAAALILASRATLAVAQTLYDGALGTLPSAQRWSFAAIGSATQTLTNNAVWLDTSLGKATEAGYARTAPAPLNRTAGFTLRFGAQLFAEAHANTNRAGFSVIALADDKRGIELGFWTNRIFAQADLPLFVHAEDVLFATDTTLVEYSLSILPTNYILRADGVPILSGPIRDYTAFNGFPNPYSTPDFLFFGDDTSSASVSVSLNHVVLITAPVLACPIPGVLTWQGVSNESYRVEETTNFTDWTVAGEVTSNRTDFGFTNSASGSFRFYRLVYP
jgi:hypothetical protein